MAMFISTDDPVAVAATEAIKASEFRALNSLLKANPDLAKAYIGTPTEARTLLHIVTDWPGHLPYCVGMIHLIVLAGADVDAPFIGPSHKETPLHWAASCGDLSAMKALMDQGVTIDPTGGVIANGTPLTDAVAFRQWEAAKLLLERGAKPNIRSAAALGLMDNLREAFGETKSSDTAEIPLKEDLDYAFWYACHGGQLEAAQFLHTRGADPHVMPPWSEGATVLDAAKENDNSDDGSASELAEWLRSIGVSSTKQ
jgi:hypothetical protein